jgi:hypothetical protein
MARSAVLRVFPLILAAGCSDPPAGTTATPASSTGEASTSTGSTGGTTTDDTTGALPTSTTGEPGSSGDGSSGGTTGGPDPYLEADPLFELGQVAEFDIILSDGAIAALTADGKQYTKGDLVATIAGVTHELGEIGVRLKGNYGSYRELDQKAAFLLNFDRYVDDQTLLGIEKLAVNNMVQDCSMQREILVYSLFRDAGVPAPRAGYVVVSVNGEPYGLYTAVESADNKVFLDHWFQDNDGNLYEGAYGSDIATELVPSFDQDNGDDIALADLYDFAAELDAFTDPATFVADVEALVDLPEYLAFAATEIYLGHWDGYAWTRNNFYVHRSNTPGARWAFLPWGIDQTLRDHMNPFGGDGRVEQMCVASPMCRELLGAAFLDAIARVQQLDLPAVAADLGDTIAPLVAADPRKECTDADNANSIAENIAFYAAREASIKDGLKCTDPGAVDEDGDGYSACLDDCDDGDPDINPGAQETCDLDDDNCDGVWDNDPICPPCVTKDLPGPGTAQFCFVALPFAEAEADCVAQGGHLLSVHTQAIQDWAQNEAFAIAGDEWWIGLNDVAQEGAFKWTDGTPVDFDYWNEGEPNNAGEEDCANIPAWTGGRWNDLPCDHAHPYICRTP